MTQNTPFNTWLETLGGRRADMPMTVRGLPISHSVVYPGDMRAATLSGSVKVAPDATTELAVFSVASPVFADAETTWTVTLTGSQTASLPSDADGDGRADFVFDFLLTQPISGAERLFGGLFPVSGFVTEPA